MASNSCNDLIKEVYENSQTAADENGCFDKDTMMRDITHVSNQLYYFQNLIKKHIENNYVQFMPDYNSVETYLEQGEELVVESQRIWHTVTNETQIGLEDASQDLKSCIDELENEVLGLSVAQRILQIDDYLQKIQEANEMRDFIEVYDLLRALHDLVFNDNPNRVDELLVELDCYKAIKVKYHAESSCLKQNLQQRFEDLVVLTEKTFPSTKAILIEVSKEKEKLRRITTALFQTGFDPKEISDFLMNNCFVPIMSKPVSLETTQDDPYFLELKISYSIHEPGDNLRPPYTKVFENICTVFRFLESINVAVSEDRFVFSIIGDQIKEPLCTLLMNNCLLHALPETMADLRDCTLVQDVLQLNEFFVECSLFDSEKDRVLTEFIERFPKLFQDRFGEKILERAIELMRKDLQDMTPFVQRKNSDEATDLPFAFPSCMISKSTLELIQLMEDVLRQTSDTNSEEDKASFTNAISMIIHNYVIEVPRTHEKLLESIPQQPILLYNNCMFLNHWIMKNSNKGIPDSAVLCKTLQITANKFLNGQQSYQQDLIFNILKNLDLSDELSIGLTPLKLVRQCMRQLDLLKNVWLDILPAAVYRDTFVELLDVLCFEVIRRILALVDISAPVASQLSDLIDVILEKGPLLFKDKHDVLQLKYWMKLQQLKTILNASLQEITDLWCRGEGILTANYQVDEVKHLIRALFQNTDRRAKALATIIQSYNYFES